MDLGNLFFKLGLSSKDFDDKMEKEIEKAKMLKKELQEALKGTSLGGDKSSAEAMKILAEARKLNAEAKKLETQSEKLRTESSKNVKSRASSESDALSTESDLYQKLYNKIRLINEEQRKLSTNAKFGFDSPQVTKAINDLQNFKNLLKDALNSGSKQEATNALKLYSNQDYAVLERQVANLINEGNKLSSQKRAELSNNAKVREEEEKRAVVIAKLTSQLDKLSQAEERLKFAQAHGAKGTLTNGGIVNLRAASDSINREIENVKRGSINNASIAQSMNLVRATISSVSDSIQRQRVINQEADRQSLNGKRQILERQRAINEAQAQNAIEWTLVYHQTTFR